MIDFEPGTMWIHRGQLSAAQEIIKKLRDCYKDSKFGDFMDDMFKICVAADKELATVAEKKNQDMFNEIKTDIEARVSENGHSQHRPGC